MKFGGVEVNFESEPKTQDVPVVLHETAHIAHEQPLGGADVSMALTSEQQRLIEDMEVVDMHITDPVEYENRAVDQLVHGGRSLDA